MSAGGVELYLKKFNRTCNVESSGIYFIYMHESLRGRINVFYNKERKWATLGDLGM